MKVLRAKTRLQKARPTGKPAAPKGRMRSDRPKERKRPDRPKRTDAAPLKPVKPQREPTTPPAKEEPKVKLDSQGAKPAAP